MIAYTTFLLCLIGIFSSIRVSVKADKVVSFLAFCALFFVFENFCSNMFEQKEHIFSFMWNSSPSGDIVVDIISNPYNYALIFPFFAITTVMAGNNIIFRYEERRAAYDAVLVFNLMSLIMIVTSNNFVQLLSALFMVDILAVLMIKDIDACRRYVVLNILADMMLFAVLAVINCQLETLDMRQILLYKEKGAHIDFVSIAGVSAVFMKMGSFMFQSGLLGLKEIRFHRLQNVLFLFSPTAALLLLLKFHNLWTGSFYFNSYVEVICVLSLLWGCGGLLVVDSFKAKTVYLQMMFWALLVHLLKSDNFEWSARYSALLLAMFVLNSAMYMMYFYTNRKKTISEMQKVLPSNPKLQIATGRIAVLALWVLMSVLVQKFGVSGQYFEICFMVLLLFSLGIVMQQVYCKDKILPTKTCAMPLKLSAFLLLVFICVCVIVGTRLTWNEWWAWSGCAGFLIWSRYAPKFFSKLYKSSFLQKSDVFGSLGHYLLMEPISFSGRFLWLLVDWVFIEKSIVRVLNVCTQSAIRFFRQLHSNIIWGGMALFVVVVALFVYVYMMGGMG